jgi:hypothetical protein
MPRRGCRAGPRGLDDDRPDPQTASIAAGAALISCLSYRTSPLAVIAVVATCAAIVLARPAREPGSWTVTGAIGKGVKTQNLGE